MKNVRLAFTMGDPAGIGPEITLKALDALARRPDAGAVEAVVVGCRDSFARIAGCVEGGEAMLSALMNGSGPARFVDIGEGQGAGIRSGEPSAVTGELAYRAICQAVDLVQADEADAIVTAPVSKEAISLSGRPFSGHTELLAELSGGREPVMMLAHGHIRVSHVTTHVPLAEVPGLMTHARVRHVAELTWNALRNMGLEAPRVAIAALNPHAGEGGILGTNDQDVTVPVVEELRARGMDISGPVPGDTVFVKLRARQYDAVVAIYHDQGHIPVKLLGFSVDEETGAWNSLEGVNITLGLPVIRTSVDHGTAFDIAGKGVASATSLIDAVDYAARLCGYPGTAAR